MADPLTHALMGASLTPHSPILGAAAGLLPDLAVVPMNIITVIRYGRLATGNDWDLAPKWTQDMYRVMHGAAPAVIAAWFTPYAWPCLAHVIIDTFTHKSTSILWPGPTLSIGKDWWTDWRIPVTTLLVSGVMFLLSCR